MKVADAAADAVEARHRTHWERGNSCEVICTSYIRVIYGWLGGVVARALES